MNNSKNVFLFEKKYQINLSEEKDISKRKKEIFQDVLSSLVLSIKNDILIEESQIGDDLTIRFRFAYVEIKNKGKEIIQ